MLIKRLDDCEEIIANDGCRLKEVLHADRDAVDLPYSLAFARVDPGKATLSHRLASQDEVYTIFNGSGIMHIGEEEAEVSAGDTIHIPAGSRQWIENTGSGELYFSALVSPPWREEDDLLV